jgi:hypothetical protein
MCRYPLRQNGSETYIVRITILQVIKTLTNTNIAYRYSESIV